MRLPNSQLTKPVYFFHRMWNSPTLMTWGSFAIKGIYLVTVLPLLLTRLSAPEISLWYFFLTVIGLQTIMDIGFSPTFSRIIAFAMGGTGAEHLKRPKIQGSGNPNLDTIRRIIGTMYFIYMRISLAWFFILGGLGTLLVVRPISLVENKGEAWISWGVILICSSMTLWGTIYSSFLQGINQVALLRRWEMIFSAGAILSSVSVLLAGGKLLCLTLVYQAWLLATVIRNNWLSKKKEGKIYYQEFTQKKDVLVMKAVWPSAWRSAVGLLLSYGMIQFSGILYSQLATAAQSAMYFLALRLIQMINQFSQAPFYSKLPTMARLYSEGRKTDLLSLAKNGMALAYWSFVFGFVILGLTGSRLLHIIGSNTQFPPPLLWALLGLGFFVERYGAMHIQLYSLTNDIIWHVANGIMGLIFVIVVLLSYHAIGVYAFPSGIIVGYIGFYAWYSAIHSYQEFEMNVAAFEISTSIPPFIFVLIYFFWIIK